MRSLRPASGRTPRIALVSDWFPPRLGGVESHLLDLGRALTNAGAEVSAITAQPGAQGTDFAVHALASARLPGLDLAISPGLLRSMRETLEAVSPDVVHIHASIVAPACLAGLIAARRAGLPVVLTLHSDIAAVAPLFRLIGPRLQGVMLSAVSARIARQLAPLTRGRAPLVLPNGFESAFWMADASPVPPTDAFRLVSAMRLERKKRPHVLRAMRARLAAALDRPVEIVVAGEGPRRAGLAPDILAPGWLDRAALRDLYRGANAFVMPCRHESFGIAALEARAAGLPVIGRAANGLAEFIRHGEDGFLCKSDADMTDAALRLAGDPALWQRMAGPRPELARYEWSAVARRHLDVYAQAASFGQ